MFGWLTLIWAQLRILYIGRNIARGPFRSRHMKNTPLAKRLISLATFTICLTPSAGALVAVESPCQTVEICRPLWNQRTVSISKLTSPTAAQAILKAEKKNPGWKVVNCKELSKSWSLTLKKQKWYWFGRLAIGLPDIYQVAQQIFIVAVVPNAIP